MKHTPGPWRIEPWTYNHGKEKKIVMQNNTDAVAEIWNLYRPDDERNAEQNANARLIAAAPEILALLKEYHKIIPCQELTELIDRIEGGG